LHNFKKKILAKYKKVVVEKENVVTEKKTKWFFIKIKKRFLLNPIPYEICPEQKKELVKLIKFCK
jgi:hypothetical protein